MRQGGEVDVCADVDEAGVAERGDESVRADTAEGGGGDGVEGAVVKDQGGAGRLRFCCFGCWDGGAADAAGEFGGVGLRFRAYFDDGVGGGFEGLVAGGGFGEDEGGGVGGVGEGELEFGRWGWGGGGGRGGGDD